MVRPSMRGGVPVFNRPTANPRSRSFRASAFEGGSPARPPSWFSSPTWMRPPRKVPTVITTQAASMRTPMPVTTPRTASPSTTRSETVCWRSASRGVRSSAPRMWRR